MERFDAIVIGAGQGGQPLAREWAKAGRKTALIERRWVGGTCANTGCTPTKALLASALTAQRARDAMELGVAIEGTISVDWAKTRDRALAIVADFRQGGERETRRVGVDLIYGQARLSGPKQVTATLRDGGERILEAEQIFLNVGARPRVPNIPGLASAPYLDNASIERLETLPRKLLILGGGYIAVEFAQMFRRFGSDVEMFATSPRLVSKEDEDISEELAKILTGEGIVLHTGGKATEIIHRNDEIALRWKDGDGRETQFYGTHLLVAAGRTPNTDDLGLDQTAAHMGPGGYIQANERLETGAPGIYAIGDCKGGPQFTHIAYDDFRILRDNLLLGQERTDRDRLVPFTIFTDPQLGRVGMTESEAQSAGKHYRVAKLPMSESARGIETGQTKGFLKALVEDQTDQILGCAMLCDNGGEIMGAAQLAMWNHMPWQALRDGVFAHPTLIESLNNLFMTLDKS